MEAGALSTKGFLRAAALVVLSVLFSSGPGLAGQNRPILHLYSAGARGEICVIAGDGSDRHCLTDNRRFDYDAVWSPDATRIAFVQQLREPRNPDVYVMSAAGRNTERLTRSPYDDDEPQWSPDGTRLVWNRNRGDSPTGRLLVMNADGTGKHLLAGRERDDAHARWSPAGEEILFESRDDCYSAECVNFQLDLHVVGVDGTNERSLTRTDANETAAAWSPDGTRIAFVRELGGDDAEIFVMDADGTDAIQLTDLTGASFSPAWSPDGAQIAFTRITDPGNFETRLAVADVATGQVATLTTEEVGGVQPVWSPDGGRISFSGHRSLGRTASYEIHTIRPDGSELVRLTRTTGDEFQLHWSS